MPISFHIWCSRTVVVYPSHPGDNILEKSRVFHGNRAAEEECSEELEVVRIEPHKANEKPFACDGW